uniref:Uncharacterized protein n=1 Tax=Anguilla anguilla TaxID=7936 RepID=A0A0E9UY80_ANGAN
MGELLCPHSPMLYLTWLCSA